MDILNAGLGAHSPACFQQGGEGWLYTPTPCTISITTQRVPDREGRGVRPLCSLEWDNDELTQQHASRGLAALDTRWVGVSFLVFGTGRSISLLCF